MMMSSYSAEIKILGEKLSCELLVRYLCSF